MEVKRFETSPIAGQKPGTSGLRKKTKIFMEKNFVENFVQSTFNALNILENKSNVFEKATLVVGGDGRYYNDHIIQIIVQMAAAQKVSRVVIGQHGLLSTPAVSAIIRRANAKYKPMGGFILTASHNPGGIDEDCGIKYNVGNGGPAPEKVTDKIYQQTTVIGEYFKVDVPYVDLSVIGEKTYFDGKFVVEVIDSTDIYVELMKEVFDFKLIKNFIGTRFESGKFKFVFDGMNGVAGPYALAIFKKEFGFDEKSLLNCKPLKDFGGHHPDPNLTYAQQLVEMMGLDASGVPLDDVKSDVADLGAACDGDADRNMILGKRFFVTPSDSVALLAANAESCIPFFRKQGGIKALARSMPTSQAVDRVAEKLGIPLFEVPTGWKFFGNLMDADILFGSESGISYNPLICGEESFGTGSNHVREKDGIWAVIAWISLLAYRNIGRNGKKLITVEDIVTEHWRQYGRNYYCRYDYEAVETEKANLLMGYLSQVISDMTVGKVSKVLDGNWTISQCDIFEYTDPVDQSISTNQGWRFMFTDGSRFVFRLSGTGSVGATIRLYIEKYERDNISLASADALSELVAIALKISKLATFTGRYKPTVIT